MVQRAGSTGRPSSLRRGDRLRRARPGTGPLPVPVHWVLAGEVVVLVVLAACVARVARPALVTAAAALLLLAVLVLVRPRGRGLVAARRARVARTARAARDRADPRPGSPFGPGGPRVREVPDRAGRPVAVLVHTPVQPGRGPGAGLLPGRVSRLPAAAPAAGPAPGPAGATGGGGGPVAVVASVAAVPSAAVVPSVAVVLSVAAPEPAVRARRGEGAPSVDGVGADTVLRIAAVLRRRSGAPSAVQVLTVCSGTGAGRPVEDPVRRSYAALTAGRSPLVRRVLVAVRLDPDSSTGAAETARHGGGPDGAVRAVAVAASRLEAELVAAGLVVRVLDGPALRRALDLAAGTGRTAPASTAGGGVEPADVAGPFEESRTVLRWAGGWHACWVPRRLPADPGVVTALLDLVGTCPVRTAAASLELTVDPRGGLDVGVVLRLVGRTRQELDDAGAGLVLAAAELGVRLVRCDDEHGPLTVATLPTGGTVADLRATRSAADPPAGFDTGAVPERIRGGLALPSPAAPPDLVGAPGVLGDRGGRDAGGRPR